MTRTLLFVLLAGCACERGTWYSRTTAGITSAMFACDYAQTMRFSDGGQWVGRHESDPLLGRTPSAAVLTLNTLLGVGAAWVVSEVKAPRWAKAAAYGVLIGEETYAITTDWHVAPACGAEN